MRMECTDCTRYIHVPKTTFLVFRKDIIFIGIQSSYLVFIYYFNWFRVFIISTVLIACKVFLTYWKVRNLISRAIYYLTEHYTFQYCHKITQLINTDLFFFRRLRCTKEKQIKLRQRYINRDHWEEARRPRLRISLWLCPYRGNRVNNPGNDSAFSPHL